MTYPRKQHGNVLSEYALQGGILIILMLGSLAMLSQSIQHTLTGVAEVKSENSTLSLLNPVSNAGGSPSAMTGSVTSTGTKVTFTTAKGTAITLDNVPTDPSSVILTAGANGATNLLADTLTQLANQLKAAGEVTDSQYNSLIALANEGHNLGSLEAEYENIVATTTDVTKIGKELKSEPGLVTNGGEYNLGYDPNLQNPLVVADVFDKKGARAGTLQFLNAYDAAEASGALKDPVVKKVIDSLAGNIAYISHSVGATTGNIRYGLVSADQMTTAMASAVTHYDSAGICSTGNGADSGIQCSAQ